MAANGNSKDGERGTRATYQGVARWRQRVEPQARAKAPWAKDSKEMAYTRRKETASLEKERRNAKDRTSTGIINIGRDDWNTILKNWKTAGLDERSLKEEGEKIIQRSGRNGKWELTNGMGN